MSIGYERPCLDTTLRYHCVKQKHYQWLHWDVAAAIKLFVTIDVEQLAINFFDSSKKAITVGHIVAQVWGK